MVKKRKVLHVMAELRPSGAEVMLKLAAPYWRKLGCELQAVATASVPGEFSAQLEDAGFTIFHAPLRRRWKLIPSAYRLFALFKRERPDVVHVHTEGMCVVPIALAALAGARIFRTVHNNFRFEGRLRRRKAWERLLCRALGCRFIAISSSVQETERSLYGNSSDLLWNWFDASTFRPPSDDERAAARSKLGLDSSQLVLVSVGNGSDIKNYAAIIRALAELGDPNLTYLQVGNPHPEGTDRTLAHKLNISSQVRFCGPSHQVRDFLWASDIYLMPSLFEGFGLSAVEAMACALPCLLADGPGLADFRSLAPGLTYCPPNTRGVTEGLRKILANLAEIRAASQADSSVIRAEFSTEKRALGYYEAWTHNER